MMWNETDDSLLFSGQRNGKRNHQEVITSGGGLPVAKQIFEKKSS